MFPVVRDVLGESMDCMKRGMVSHGSYEAKHRLAIARLIQRSQLSTWRETAQGYSGISTILFADATKQEHLIIKAHVFDFGTRCAHMKGMQYIVLGLYKLQWCSRGLARHLVDG